jgi:hypothetical protein
MVWQHWVNFLVGLWIVLSAYLGFSSDTMVMNLTISGIIVAILALWGALAQGSSRSYNRMEERRHSHA